MSQSYQIPCWQHSYLVNHWQNYYAVLITAPNDRSRSIDCYLGIVVRVIMSLVGFHRPVAWSLVVRVGWSMLMKALNMCLSSIYSGIAACFQTSTRAFSHWSTASTWMLSELCAVVEKTCTHLHVVVSWQHWHDIPLQGKVVMAVWMCSCLSQTTGQLTRSPRSFGIMDFETAICTHTAQHNS